MTRLRIVAAALAAGALATGGAFAAGEGGDPRTVAVTLDEWAITTDRASVPAGPVTFAQRNDGRVDHHLLVVRTDLPADRIPQGLGGPAPEQAGRVVLGEAHGAHDHGDGSAEEHLRPGERARARVRLAPGRYVLLCTLPGHYAAGQHAALVVSAQ